MSDVAAIVLAAGSASRFRASAGKNGPVTKLVALLDGKALVRRVAEAALASRARPVIVVTGHARAEVEAALVGLPLRFIHNADFASGLASSLKAGIAAAPADAQGALILLGDMPDLSVGVIDALIAARAAHPGAKAIVPLFGGKRGNPALVSRTLFQAVAQLEGDIGARALIAAAGADIVETPVDDAAIHFDVDTPEVLAARQAAPARGSKGAG